MSKKPKSRSKIPYFFLAFFAVFITVDMFYIYIANKSWRGVAIQNSYHKGLNYNQTINQSKTQAKLGWQVKISLEPMGNNISRLRIDLKDAQNNPIQNAEISADFKRPTQEGYDFSSTIDFDGKAYVKELSFPLKGQWNIELTVTKNGQIFKTAQRRIVH